MLTLVFIGFLAASVSVLVHRLWPKASGILLTLVPVSMFVYLLTMMPQVSNGDTIIVSHTWFKSFNISLSFIVDGLSITMGLIVSGIGAIIVFYASGYLKGHKKLARFYAYLLFFMTSMFGVVLSNNIISLFIFWELTSVSSYLLIGFNHEQERSRYASLQALLVTGGGGLALMAGLILLGNVAGTYTISELLHLNPVITGHGLYIPILILILLGAFTKSAQFPFHFWLPNAMEAPTPVSAYLHSATMVKAGVFLLARLNPALSGPEIWHTILLSFGAVTMLMGAAMAIGQNDLKRILAYTTISALGIMVFLIGLGTNFAITAALTFLVVHAMYKGGLFLVAGAIDHETGTRDIRKLGGLFKLLPLVGIGAVLAALSYAGIPPFFGFIAKELIYEAAYNAPLNPYLLLGVAILTNMFLVATAIMVGVKPFFGSYKETPKHPHHAPLSLWIGPVILGSLGVIFGVVAFIPDTYLIAPAALSVFASEGTKLYLWHGFNIILFFSFLTLLGGLAFYKLSSYIKKHMKLFNKVAAIGPEELYKKLLQGMLTFAKAQISFFQNGYLRHYFMWILGFFVGLIVLTVFSFNLLPFIKFNLIDIEFYEALVVFIMFFAAFAAIASKSVLASVAALGIVGYGIALIFTFYSAPDLAMTQFSIETLTVILLVFIVYNVPKFTDISPRKTKIRDIAISATVGLCVTLLLLIVLNSPADAKISDYFLDNSYLEAHGRNVVNVILVDFRALDTMGEITVLAIAAIGVYTLLKFRRRKKMNKDIRK